MRLSKLHISGFKSFPDRAELGFDQGVTAIVGPNGCGKSNVVDAITWVLGEQSAKSLRGERMEDIIFNGSDGRRPTATAEVRLKLADVAQAAMPAITGGDQFLDEQPLIVRNVEIGRRLYRSGESEYLIDGEICRLRDIHDLLMDSGLGVKAYAVIEQGKIGQILSSRPAERRTLIEEAAGVTKYKSRRRSAELKLEAARQNLTRIDDIIFEVEKQRGALKRQAARARRYKRLREELRRWEQVQLAQRHATLSQEIQAAETRLAAAREREASAAAQVSELEMRLERIRLDLTGAESMATSAREQAHARELEIGRREQQIQFDRQQAEDLGRRLETFGAEASELIGRRGPARAAIEAQRDARERVRLTLEQAAGQVDHCEAAYSRALAAVQRAEQQADETRAAVLASNTTLSALRQARGNAAEARDRVAAERSRLDVEARDLEQEGGRARAGRDEAVQALERARGLLEAAGQRRVEIEADLGRRRVSRDDLSEVLTLRQRELAGHEARLHSLEDLNNRRATFGDAARYLLAEPAASVRHHGAVADHLDVQRSFERAVDALLGDLLQHVLVDTHQDAEQALARLIDADAGRCGFVVLHDTRPAHRSPALERPAGVRTLRDVVRAKGPHAASIASLIGDALIAGSFEEARQLAGTIDMPVATLAGEVFRGPAVIEGGARRDAHGILEMRGDIERRRDELKQAAADVHHLSNEMLGLDLVIGQAENALAERVDELHAQEKLIVAGEGQMARHEDELARLTRRLHVVETERRRAGEEEKAAERRREEASAAIEEQEAQQRGAEGRLGEVMAHLSARREEAEAAMRLVTEARTEQATLSERVAGLETEIARLEESAQELETRIAARQEEMQRAEVRRLELRGSITETEALLDRDICGLEAHRQQVREADEGVVSRREDFGVREHQIRGARHSLEAIRSEVMQSEVAKATAAADLAHLASTCFDAVSASIEDVVLEVARMEREGELAASGKRLAAISAPDEDEGEGADETEPRPLSLDAADEAASAGSLRAGLPSEAANDAIDPRRQEARNLGTSVFSPEDIIADLRRKIERLGPVNMMAIEQFDDLEARHTFLTSQRKDLLDSIGQTNEAIRKIDKTTRERFEEAFASINSNFEGTFTTLFGGGSAGLVLIDQDNDPESGIDIIAQPPGKRLQNVQLLSGGEKALTAMALMFAIFKYRPSPFCLLDEIDAPLDDANIGRFVEMLRGMQAHTQFILITHNRKTMEIANRLYGVTMEEPGVSKLISLQLN